MRRDKCAQQHDRYGGLVLRQQRRRAVAGTCQQDAVYPLADEKVKQLVDVFVSRAAATQHDLITELGCKGFDMQGQGGVERAGDVG